MLQRQLGPEGEANAHQIATAGEDVCGLSGIDEADLKPAENELWRATTVWIVMVMLAEEVRCTMRINIEDQEVNGMQIIGVMQVIHLVSTMSKKVLDFLTL